MQDHERRRAARLPIAVPATIETTGGPVEGGSYDLSRVGVRLRVPCRDLGFAPSLNLASTAVSVRDALSGDVPCTLRNPAAAAAVDRAGGIARIALPLDAPDSVELGLHFDAPLTDEDAARLGVVLPPLRADVAEPEDAPADEPAAVAGDAVAFATSLKRAYRAYLTSAAPDAPPSLLCHGDNLNREAVRVRMPRDSFDSPDATEVTSRFAARYGTRLTIKLMDVHKHLWTGPVRLCAVELPPDRPADMLLTFAFERRLRPAELQRLGLDRGAA